MAPARRRNRRARRPSSADSQAKKSELRRSREPRPARPASIKKNPAGSWVRRGLLHRPEEGLLGPHPFIWRGGRGRQASGGPARSHSVSCGGARALRTKGQESTLTDIRSVGGIMTRKFSVFAASFVVATGLFGTWTLTSSTVAEATIKPGVDVSQIEFKARTNLQSFDDKYQRNIGVLDTFAAS